MVLPFPKPFGEHFGRLRSILLTVLPRVSLVCEFRFYKKHIQELGLDMQKLIGKLPVSEKGRGEPKETERTITGYAGLSPLEEKEQEKS